MGTFQSNINNLTNTVAGGALGIKHIYNQDVSNATAAQDKEAQAQENVDKANLALKEFETENNPNDLVANTLAATGKVNRLESDFDSMDKAYADLSEAEKIQHPRGEGGKFISKEQHLASINEERSNLDKETDRIWNELEAAKRAKQELQTKMTAWGNLQSDVQRTRSNLQLANENRVKAQARLDKWKLGGKK